MEEKKIGKIVVISGPSGVGKKTVWTPIINELKFNLSFSISMTTRPKRKGEINGKDYFFVTKRQFTEAVATHKLLEYAEFANNYYGTPKKYVDHVRSKGKNVLLEIEPKGGLQVINICKKNKDANILTIFIAPPSLKELEKRLINRSSESKKVIKQRIEQAKWEIKQKKHYQYVIINKPGQQEKATKKLFDILSKNLM